MSDDGRERVAIVGLAGRFPGAADVGELWRNLRAGRESIRRLSDDELRAAGVPEELLRDPRYVKAAPVLDDVEGFDAAFFGFSPREAEVMDPQQRLFLECACAALEDAGHDPSRAPGAVGVFAGAGFNCYFVHNVLTHPELFRSIGGQQLVIRNDKDFLCTLVAYELDLRGPALSVQTACSTGLVAVHTACQSLLSYECDLALAGGVSLAVPQVAGYQYQEGQVFSADGHVRAFDAQATGCVFGSGVAIVALKRLSDALRDGNSVHAVILGSAVNNDGARKVSYTAPSVEGQAAAVIEALEVAGVDPASVGYVEAHGTGTPLGDPIEVAALGAAFRRRTAERGFCALGTVKSNLGHLDTAAGVTGLIKAALCLREGELVPSLHFHKAPPEMDLEASPFFVNTELRAWPRGSLPRRAGVSSLGIGGTNAHAVLEEPPHVAPDPSRRAWHLLTLSARTRSALETASANLVEHLRAHPGVDLGDVAFTLLLGRRRFEQRRAFVARDARDAAETLEARALARLSGGVSRADERERPVLFLFPGEHVAPSDLAAALALDEPALRQALERCGARARAQLGYDPCSADLADPARARTALLCLEHALAEMWAAWGVRPLLALGQGRVGRSAAACASGALTLDEALARLSSNADEAGPPFDPQAAELRAHPDAILLEVGPGDALLRLCQADPELAQRPAVASLAGSALAAAGRLWVAGAPLDAHGLYAGERRRRLSLPTYPFEHKRHWIEPAARRAEGDAAPAELRGMGASTALPGEDAEQWSEVERTLGALWRELLGLERVALHDDFFELGGHSLLASQVSARVAELFPIDVDVEDVFLAPTVAQLARTIEERLLDVAERGA